MLAEKITARVLVQIIAGYELEDLGTFHFMVLPRPGDELAIKNADGSRLMRVITVRHRPVTSTIGAAACGIDLIVKEQRPRAARLAF